MALAEMMILMFVFLSVIFVALLLVLVFKEPRAKHSKDTRKTRKEVSGDLDKIKEQVNGDHE